MRSRLLDMLKANLSRPFALTLVSAPAGYGKTTFVLNSLQTTKQSYAWLSLEPEDDSFSRFVIYLASTLQTIRPTIGKSTLTLLEGIQLPKSEIILSNLINDLSKQPACVLVLDDYHVITSPEIHAFIESLMEHAQPHLQLIIATRADPPLPLAKWRARNLLAEIRANDLKFNFQEATEFLRRIMSLDLQPQQIQLLEERTEGWVAGLQLAALSMRTGRTNTQTLTVEGTQRDIADYLMAEVLAQLPAEWQDFLLQTSILNRLSASLCNAITEKDDSQSMLETIEAGNLFTIPLDESRTWFRYHHLFIEFLQRRLQKEYSEKHIQGLHQRASRWLAENRFIPEAIDHAIAAKDFEYAAQLFGPQAETWMRHGEVRTILSSLKKLPDELVWNQWDLCLWYGWTYAVTGDLNPAERWVNRLEALITSLMQDATQKENRAIPSGLQNAYAQVLAIRSSMARQNKDFVSAMALGEQALQLIPEENLNLRTIISTLLSSVVLESGKFNQAESLLYSTRKSSYQAGNPFITFTLLLNESALSVMRGQLQPAHDLNNEALRLAETESMDRLAFLPQLRLGRVNYLWNQLVQAKQYVTTALAHADVNAYPSATVRGYITLAWIQNAEGQYPQALQTLADVEQIALNHHGLESVEMVRGVRAQLQLSAGENEAAVRWAKSSDWESLESSKSGLILSDESFFPYCQVLIASSEALARKRAERLLAWRLHDSEQQRRESAILKIRLMQALLYYAENHRDLAIASLLQALALAMPENCIRPFLDEGQSLIPYLRRVSRQHSVYDFAQKILACATTRLRHPPIMESFNQQELKILQLMAQGYTNPEIARKLMLAVSTVRWYVKQIFRKLGVHNRTQAAAQAKKINLV